MTLKIRIVWKYKIVQLNKNFIRIIYCTVNSITLWKYKLTVKCNTSNKTTNKCQLGFSIRYYQALNFGFS